MKNIMFTFALACTLTFAALPALAACYADYQAKQNNPLRLHYGVIALPGDACDKQAATEYIAARISGDGWSLLRVMSVFDEAGLQSRQSDAGGYYLRY